MIAELDPLRLHPFERFYRGDAAHARAQGAGLGLSIARWIAHVHHATIAIDSAAGRGTLVVVTFPVGGNA